jgi:tetratricopeptide repeat protein
MFRAMGVAIGLALAAAGLGAVGKACAADLLEDAAALQRTIDAAEAREGATSPGLLPLLDRLAHMRFEEGDLAAATAADRRGLKIAIAAFGANSARAAEAMTALARAELDQLHYLDAEGLLIAAETIVSARFGADSSKLIPVLSGLARIAVARGSLADADLRAERAVSLTAKYPAAVSAESLRVLGAALGAEHKFDQGERTLERALAEDRAAGGDSLETARDLSALGNLYLRADRFSDALAPLEQAAAIDQARLAPTHPWIGDDFNDIGIADEGLKRTEAARLLLAAAVRLLESGGAQANSRLAFAELELARVDREAGSTAAADELFHDAQHILNAAEDAERKRERRV